MAVTEPPQPGSPPLTLIKVLGGRGGGAEGEREAFLQKGSFSPSARISNLYSNPSKHLVRSSRVSRRRMSFGVPSLVMSTSAARGRWL